METAPKTHTVPACPYRVFLCFRQIVLDKVTDDDIPRSERVHNSLTPDGLSMPVYPKSKSTIAMGKHSSKTGHQVRMLRKYLRDTVWHRRCPDDYSHTAINKQ